MKYRTHATLLAGTLLAISAVQGATVAHWNFEDGEAGKPFATVPGAGTGSRDTVGRVLMHGWDSRLGPSFSSDNLYYNGLCLRAAGSHQDGYVIDGPLMSWAPQAWTIECTVRMDKIAEWNTFIGRDGSSAGEQPADFYLQYSGAEKCFSLKFRTAGGQFVIINTTDLIAKMGQWYGLAAVSDGTKVSLYVDDRGGKGYQLEGTASLTDTDAANNALAGSKLNWIFGRGWYNGRGVDHINGYMDNIRFSDAALKPSELIPVPGDPLVITHSREELFAYMPQRIEVQIADADSEFRSAELFLDDRLVAANKARSGERNSVSHTSTELAPGTHNARVVVEGINPPVKITKSWTFEVQKAPVDFVAEGEFRTWTDDAGKTIDAKVVEVADGKARFETREGQVLMVPISKLSTADQERLSKQNESSAPSDLKPGEWPTTVSVGTDIEVEESENESADKGPRYVYRTQHFEFRSEARLGKNVVREFARLFEATFEVVRAIPLELDPKPPEKWFIVRLLETMEDYHEAGGPVGSGGVYFRSTREILVPLESLGVKRIGKRYTLVSREANGVLVHEVTHQLMHRWLGVIPVWINEGLAEFVGSMKYRLGRFALSTHDDLISEQVAMRTYESSGFDAIRLNDLFRMTRRGWNKLMEDESPDARRIYPSSMLVAYYFCREDGDGSGLHLKRYLHALMGGENEETARNEFLLRGRSLDEIQEEVIRFWQRKRLDIVFSPLG